MNGRCADCGGELSDTLIGNVCERCYKRIVPRQFWPKALREQEERKSA